MGSASMPPPPLPGPTGIPPPTAAPTSAPRPLDDIVLPSNPGPPAQILTTDARVTEWPQTPGYRGFIGWLKQVCGQIRGRTIIEGDEGASSNIAALLGMLDSMSLWVEEVPPQSQKAQRFGNLAFRQYIALVEERLPGVVGGTTMSATLQNQILPLLLQSHAFGHPVRIDYGTGHELAFALVLWCCVVSGWISGEYETELVLRVFPRYLDLTTKLQVTYRLEPAGSHGVWGLDDYCFLPYLFGSAQLVGGDVSPSEALENATKTQGPFTDLYTLSLYRISLFKRGAAFREHSPLLHSLSEFPNWVKPHGGLLKMFQAEVLGKRVVVQGLFIGGWCWGDHMPAAEKRKDASQKPHNDTPPTSMPTTAAPWAAGGATRGVGAIPQR